MPGDNADRLKPKTRKRPGAPDEPEKRQTAIPHVRQEAAGSSAQRVTALVELLQAAATCIEANPAQAQALLDGCRESGAQLSVAPKTVAQRGTRHAPSRAQSTAGTPSTGSSLDAAHPLDPFATLREQGEPGLRARLRMLDLEALRTLVRSHRLDPGRVASRWTDRERLMELIVEQVQARAGLGRAFERV